MPAADLLSGVPVARGRRVPRRDLAWVPISGAVALVAWLALVPLAFLLWQSFQTPETASAPAQLTLGNYRAAYASAETARLLANSLAFAAGAALVSFTLGAGLAFINERTDTPFKLLFFSLAVVPLVIPSVLFTVAWILLASPKIGLVNLALQGWLGTDAVFVDVYSLGGMIWVDGLHYSPMAFLLMTAALRSMDPALEESALISGATALQVARRITLRLVWPAVLGSVLILFVRAIESFEVPALLGLPVGIEVYTSAIYQAVHRYPSEVGLACAYAVALLAIAGLCVAAQARLAGQAGRYATITGKGFRPRVMAIGRWRYLTASLFFLYLAVIVVLPSLVLLWSSLQKFYRVPSAAALGAISLDAYRAVLDYPGVAAAVWNSLLLAFGAATLVMLATSVLCWVVVRTRIPGRSALDGLASLPLAVPGLVLGLAIMICYLHVDIGVYGTLWIMLIAYVTRFMPYGMRYNATSMLQLHKELEESAALCGASWATTFRRIVLPLLKPGLVAGWIYVVILAVRELSSSILLYSPGSEVVSIVIWELWQNGQYVELSALGVMLIAALFALVVAAQLAGRRFGIVEA
jgi:iron(III) transport system permease protein